MIRQVTTRRLKNKMACDQAMEAILRDVPGDNLYGLHKRLCYIEKIIRESNAKCILDIGCGSGHNVTIPMARRFPEFSFVGRDSDIASIKHAREKNRLPNLSFELMTDENPAEQFDVIIASEVIEHVPEPGDFLLSLRQKLTEHGKLILTLPNGTGPFEMMALIESIFHLTGAYAIARRIKHAFSKRLSNTNVDTLAISPHVNFFGFKEIQRIATMTGYKVLEYHARTFVCGFGLDHLFGGRRFIYMNERLADHLAPQLVSDWMLLLEKRQDDCTPHNYAYKRTPFARLRKYLNEKRYTLR